MKTISFDVVKTLEESKKRSIKKVTKSTTGNSNNLPFYENSNNIYENMKNMNENDEEYSDIEIELPVQMKNRLFEHQNIAVEWLSKIHVRYPGCILGDDMGMGKTFSIISFLCNLYLHKHIERTLILCPVSVLENWNRELNTYLMHYLPVSVCKHLYNF